MHLVLQPNETTTVIVEEPENGIPACVLPPDVKLTESADPMRLPNIHETDLEW